MEKVKVNAVVAGWIEEDKISSNTGKLFQTLVRIDNHALSKGGTMQMMLEEQNIDIVTLAKAIQYGYEVPYEFKVGDLIKNEAGDYIDVVEKQQNRYERSVKYVNDDSDLFILVCKRENREDLKQ